MKGLFPLVIAKPFATKKDLSPKAAGQSPKRGHYVYRDNLKKAEDSCRN